MTDSTMPTENLFRQLEGKKAENLASQVLCHLIKTCPPFGDAFGRLLKKALKKAGAPVVFSPGLICRTEAPTSNYDPALNGRIDIAIEGDEHVIYIESKLWASLDTHQPQKYCNSLHKFATDKGKQGLLVVICPQMKQDSIREELGQRTEAGRFMVDGVNYEPVLLTWEEIAKSIGVCLGTTEIDSDQRAILRMYQEYIGDRAYTDFRPCHGDRESVLSMPLGTENNGNEAQRDVLYKVKYWAEAQTKFTVGHLGSSRGKGRGRWTGFNVVVSAVPDSQPSVQECSYWLGYTNHGDPPSRSALVIASIHSPLACEGMESIKAGDIGWTDGWSVYELPRHWEWKSISDVALLLSSVLGSEHP